MSEPSNAKKATKPRKPKREPTKEEIAEKIQELTNVEKELQNELSQVTAEKAMLQGLSCPNIKVIVDNSIEDITEDIIEVQEEIQELTARHSGYLN